MESNDNDDVKLQQRYIEYIQQEGKENSILRRNTLKLIYDELKSLKILDQEQPGGGEGGDATMNNDINYIKLKLPKIIIPRICDQIEKSREYAYEILSILIKSVMTNENIFDILSYLIPCLVERLGQQELNETSEEIRLIALNFIHILITKMKSALAIYIDDLLLILSNTIIDEFYSIRIKSCSVVSDLAKYNTSVFHYNSERLIKPLCTSIIHQRYTVRLACIKCIGDVILLGNHKSMEHVIPHLTQRLFDSSPQVRKAVIEVTGSFMISYVDRYSYFHKLLPLLLTGLGDESPEIILTTKELWSNIGLQYLQENIEDFKDQVDFPTEIPSHYPKNVERPNLGCRILTYSNISKLIPGICNEITDWVLNTRIKSSQLIYNLILNSEEKITMHIETILQCLFKGSQDEDTIVLNNVQKSSELIGYFVPLSITWPIIKSKIQSNIIIDSGLFITVGILKGTHGLILQEYLIELMELFSNNDICQSMKTKIQKYLIDICNILIDENIISPLNLFKILITILAVTKDPNNSGSAYDTLRKLEKALELNSFDELMGTYTCGILEGIQSNSNWTPLSPDKQIFDLILSQGGSAVKNNMDIILNIMISNLGPDKDPEVRLKFFITLSKYLKAYEDKNNTTTNDQIQHFIKHLIEDVLDPNLIWTAGKTACALRTAAISCLHATLENQLLINSSNNNIIVDIYYKLETTLFGLIEDTPELTRVMACECIRLFVENSNKNISSDHLHKIYGVLLKRLDDVSNIVRTSAACTIASIFNNVPIDYDVNYYKIHIQNVYSVLLVHMDDQEKIIQECIFDTLREIGKLLPSCMVEECEKVKTKHRKTNLCEKLISIFTNQSNN